MKLTELTKNSSKFPFILGIVSKAAGGPEDSSPGSPFSNGYLMSPYNSYGLTGGANSGDPVSNQAVSSFNAINIVRRCLGHISADFSGYSAGWKGKFRWIRCSFPTKLVKIGVLMCSFSFSSCLRCPS